MIYSYSVIFSNNYQKKSELNWTRFEPSRIYSTTQEIRGNLNNSRTARGFEKRVTDYESPYFWLFFTTFKKASGCILKELKIYSFEFSNFNNVSVVGPMVEWMEELS